MQNHLVPYVIIVLCAGCVAPSGINDPNLPGYDPNYPVREAQQAIPQTHKGHDSSYRCDEFAMFIPGDTWADPNEYYQLAANAASRGDRSAQGVLDQERRHSIKKICDDELRALAIAMYFAPRGSIRFTEGNFRFHFEDGTSAVDRGVRVIVKPHDRRDPHAAHRSYKDYPIQVDRTLMGSKKYIAVNFLIDKEHYAKSVVAIERVE